MAKDSEKRTKDSDKGEIEGETEDSEKAHKRLRKRGQHQKHRSALRALKNLVPYLGMKSKNTYMKLA